MIGAGINGALEALIQLAPVDEEAKEWLQRSNDALSIAVDATVAGGTSTAAIAAKMVTREIKDHVVPVGDDKASKLFDALSSVSQAAVGGAGSAAAFGIRATQEAAGSVARQALQTAATEAATRLGTQVAGAGVGAAAGYASSGTDGLQAGLKMGMSVGSGDLTEAGLKAGGAVVGGGAAYAAADGDPDARLKAARAGASLGTTASAAADPREWTAEGLRDLGLEQGVGLTAQATAATARVANGQEALDAFLASEHIGTIAAGQSVALRGRYDVAEGARAASALAREAGEQVGRAVADERHRAARNAIAKHGASEELVAKRDGAQRTKDRLQKGLKALGQVAPNVAAVERGLRHETLDVADQRVQDAEHRAREARGRLA